MKALALLGTLKRTELSNTSTLTEFLAERMAAQGATLEIVRLVDHQIEPGTCTHVSGGDEWPAILDRILAAQIVIFATPIWWNHHSSLIQRVIERLDELHDEILSGQPSRLDGKVAGIVVTGDSDGAQSIIGGLANFFNAIGFTLPPYATLSVLSQQQAKDKQPTRESLMAEYRKHYTRTADRMIEQLIKVASS